MRGNATRGAETGHVLHEAAAQLRFCALPSRHRALASSCTSSATRPAPSLIGHLLDQLSGAQPLAANGAAGSWLLLGPLCQRAFTTAQSPACCRFRSPSPSRCCRTATARRWFARSPDSKSLRQSLLYLCLPPGRRLQATVARHGRALLKGIPPPTPTSGSPNSAPELQRLTKLPFSTLDGGHRAVGVETVPGAPRATTTSRRRRMGADNHLELVTRRSGT